jgi:hypothetical protein
MAPETWLLLMVAAAFLLLGVAGSPLAWAALHHARKRREQVEDQRLVEIARRVRTLETQLGRGNSARSLELPGAEGRAGAETPRGTAKWTSRPHSQSLQPDQQAWDAGSPIGPTLIAVPQLGAGPTDKEAAMSGLSERYAAIWALADNGAKADGIARATGQPIGHIELILGLRRQIDGHRTTISHGSHT